jgi:cell division protein WhiA
MAGNLSADTKDALARDVPQDQPSKATLLAALALYGADATKRQFIAHRNAVARLFFSLLDKRKTHRIVTRPGTRFRRNPTFAIALPARRARPQLPAKTQRKLEARAAFLVCGSLAAGARGYHLEFVVPERALADRLRVVLHRLGREPKHMLRKRRHVLYYKDFDAIADVLGSIGAYAAVLHLSDVRALRETKNRIHRLVNTEAANLERAAAAAAAHQRTIRYLESAYGLHNLSAPLREAAELRMAYPDETLAELGSRCNPPIGKPTLASRLSSLGRLARRLHRRHAHAAASEGDAPA